MNKPDHATTRFAKAKNDISNATPSFDLGVTDHNQANEQNVWATPPRDA